MLIRAFLVTRSPASVVLWIRSMSVLVCRLLPAGALVRLVVVVDVEVRELSLISIGIRVARIGLWWGVPASAGSPVLRYIYPGS